MTQAPFPHLWDDELTGNEQSTQQVVSAVVPQLIDGHLR